MRTPIAPAALLALALAACDATPGPRAPSAPAVVRGDQADADARTKHVHGTLAATEWGVPQPGSPILVRHLEGEGIASHLGRFTTTGVLTLNLATATGTGTVSYTAANGDMLTGTAIGQAVLGGGFAVVTETVTITGGTGRFDGATGTLTVVRRVVQATGVSTGTIDGTITLP